MREPGQEHDRCLVQFFDQLYIGLGETLSKRNEA